MIEKASTVEAQRAQVEVTSDDLGHPEWERAPPVPITRYWSGAEAPAERHAEARLLWHDAALCVRYVCRQREPLVVSPHPQREEKTIGLWERDVCEIFVAPDMAAPDRYLEFEVAPTGEWLDVAVHQMTDKREVDWNYRSGMRVGAQISEGEVRLTITVPWSAFGCRPRPGEAWRVNLFRCVGAGTGRGYLAWQPTLTEIPNFHVPAAFGVLSFL